MKIDTLHIVDAQWCFWNCFLYKEGGHSSYILTKFIILICPFGFFFLTLLSTAHLNWVFAFSSLDTSRSWPLYSTFHLVQLPDWISPWSVFCMKYGECRIDIITGIINTTKCLLCVRHCSKDFILLNSLPITTALWKGSVIPILSMRKQT